MAGSVIITGANGTLALEYVRILLTRYPEYTLVGTVRNRDEQSDRNTAKLMAIIKQHQQQSTKVHIQQLDLGSLSSVRSFTDGLLSQINAGELPRISSVVCNAATWSLEAGQRTTRDGLEATFQVAHLAHFLLVLKLLGGMDRDTGRVVMLGSITHYPEKPNPLSKLRPGLPDKMEDLVHPPPDAQGEEHDRGLQRYGTAKLANVVFMNDLNQRLKKDPAVSKITCLAMDPGGLAASRAQIEQRKAMQRVMAFVNFAMPVLKHITTMFRPTGDAAADLVAVSVAPEFQGKRGYYVGKQPGTPAEMSNDPAWRTKLWKNCWKWTGLTSGETVLVNWE